MNFPVQLNYSSTSPIRYHHWILINLINWLYISISADIGAACHQCYKKALREAQGYSKLHFVLFFFLKNFGIFWIHFFFHVFHFYTITLVKEKRTCLCLDPLSTLYYIFYFFQLIAGVWRNTWVGHACKLHWYSLESL